AEGTRRGKGPVDGGAPAPALAHPPGFLPGSEGPEDGKVTGITNRSLLATPGRNVVHTYRGASRHVQEDTQSPALDRARASRGDPADCLRYEQRARFGREQHRAIFRRDDPQLSPLTAELGRAAR